MKTIALISGGKDSLLAVLMAKRYGHEPVVLANITPAASESDSSEETHEIDSYMYQTVGHEVVEGIAHCMALPLRRLRVAKGRSTDQSLLYSAASDPQDEVEELCRFLAAVKAEFPLVEGVTTGAILSNYQRNRVESVCQRLQLTSLAYLWQRQPFEILDMADALRMEAILVKTASIGLSPRKHIGKTLAQVRPTLEKLETLYGSHMAGEGGEFETIVLDCPLFVSERLVVRSLDVVVVDDNEYAPSGHAVLQVDYQLKTEAERSADATVLANLCAGQLHFPSDGMATLPREPLPSAANHSPAFHRVEGSGDVLSWIQASWCHEEATAAQVLTCSARLADHHADTIAVVNTLLEEASRGLAALHVVSKNTFLLPTAVPVDAVRSAYSTSVACIAPPICDVFSLADLSDTVYLVVEAIPAECVSETDVLHAQSVSCWAAGRKGPFALARRVTAASDDDAVTSVVTASTAGRVPADWTIANSTSAATVAALTRVLPEAQAELAVQFAYAHGNASAYGKVLGCAPCDLRGVTVFTSRPDVVEVLPQLWTWCAGATIQDRVSRTVVLVSDLEAEPDRASLALSLRWAKSCA